MRLQYSSGVSTLEGRELVAINESDSFLGWIGVRLPEIVHFHRDFGEMLRKDNLDAVLETK